MYIAFEEKRKIYKDGHVFKIYVPAYVMKAYDLKHGDEILVRFRKVSKK